VIAESRQLSFQELSPEMDFSPTRLLGDRVGKPYATEFSPDLDSYDHIVLAFSGGKDGLAMLLYLLQLGIPSDKIELWHHLVDGKESTLMDWRCTEAYCRAVAEAFNIPIYFSWREGGFEREMQRDNTPASSTYFETPENLVKRGGSSLKTTTRLKFPQTGSIQDGRWCSAILKIDVGQMSLRSQERFRGKRTLFLTGERREESTTRAKYQPFHPHESDARNGRLNRCIDHWRPVLGWDEVDVWRIIQQYCVNPHPCYRLGFGRASCRLCIFLSDAQLATIRVIDPEGFERIAAYEKQFNHTIHRSLSVHARADRGIAHSPIDPRDIAAAFSSTWDESIILTPETWSIPLGAFGESAGPN
jgi:3'-phosphoadenosine 5'-phosphosulfate sulfotransferase (PAPS reductase)/FAD synthetase